MTVHELPFTEALDMVSRMEIRDGKSICGLLQARPHLVTPAARVEGGRMYRTALGKCVRPECDGRPVELSHYERNNWATTEMQCERCGTRFTMKLEI
jgi:hypothetical protein